MPNPPRSPSQPEERGATHPPGRIRSLGWLGLALSIGAPAAASGSGDAVSYGRDVRPILSENCFYCHGQDPQKRKAGLRLDTEAGQRLEGLAVPGRPDESDLIRRILSEDPAERMPPPKSNRHLSPDQKDVLARWVAQGAKFEGHWAFRAPAKAMVPEAPGASNPIDAFVRRRLAAEGITPSPPADPRTLLRRASLDLIGLPPTPGEMAAFLADRVPGAYERAVDRLLASPHYGERMALPWLDAARYADSNGFQQDGDTFQWVWRDWVVNALNANMPFDRFTVEQVAGDLLPGSTVDQKVATAFNRNHLLNGEGGAIPEEQRFNILFDRVDATSTTWLGLTVACAQCHDHKYDPITQRDYYGLLASFNNVSESGAAGPGPTRMRIAAPFVEAAGPKVKEMAAALEQVAVGLRAALAGKKAVWEARVRDEDEPIDPAIRKLLLDPDPRTRAARDKAINAHFEEKVEPALAALARQAGARASTYRDEDIPRVMVMADDQPRASHVLDRGEYLKPKGPVTFATPSFLPPLPADSPPNRLGLARWLVAAENPLTSRVAVNRAWQAFFGVGLVRTGEDFGVQGDPPSHPELLDWLAVDFRESGWDVKRLHRLIVTSATYRQDSRASAEGLAKDPENRLYARFPRVRLPSMILRDLALAAGGLLDPRVGGRPVYPYQPEGIWDPLAITKERDFAYPASTGRDLRRRSLYTFWRRTIGPANLFDASSRQVCKVRPSVTNTPLNALTTLNDPTWTEAARALAEVAIRSSPDPDARLGVAFRRVLSRDPSPAETPILRRMLAEQAEAYRSDPGGAKALLEVGATRAGAGLVPAEHAAWTNLCLAIFNLDEALTRE